jgi:hypothetical protein
MRRFSEHAKPLLVFNENSMLAVGPGGCQIHLPPTIAPDLAYRLWWQR